MKQHTRLVKQDRAESLLLLGSRNEPEIFCWRENGFTPPHHRPHLHLRRPPRLRLRHRRFLLLVLSTVSEEN